MAWATPVTWTLGVTPTHTQFGQDLIDSPVALRTLFDASVKVYRTSNQSISNSTGTAVSWSTTSWNLGTLWAVGNPTRLTAPADGIYLLTAKSPWAASGVGRRHLKYRINGVATDYNLMVTTAQSGATRENGADLVEMTAGDYLEIWVEQDSGGSLNLLGGNQASVSATLTLVATGTTAPIWTAPRTWADGDILTPWRLNTHVRDALLNRRASNGYAAKLYLDKDVSIGTGQRETLSWTNQEFQIGDMWTDGSRLVAQVAGWYLILPTLDFVNDTAVTATTTRGVGFKVNDSSPHYDLSFQTGGGTGGHRVNGKSLVYLEAGDFLEVYAYHNYAESLNLDSGVAKTRLAICLQAAA